MRSVALLFCAFLLSGCALPGILAVSGAAVEAGTADENAAASGGFVSYTFKAACDAIDGRHNPTTGDCDRNLFR